MQECPLRKKSSVSEEPESEKPAQGNLSGLFALIKPERIFVRSKFNENEFV